MAIKHAHNVDKSNSFERYSSTLHGGPIKSRA